MRKHLTAEAEQWCRERIAQHNDNLPLWDEPDGWLVPTEPCDEERHATRERLIAARSELVELLVNFCGANDDDLHALSWRDGTVVNVPINRNQTP